MDSPRRVCFYIRVSTDTQHTDNQLRDLLAYCNGRRWPEPEPSAIFRDVISGARDSRAELDKMMMLLRKQRYDCLLVWHFDRFARSAIHALMTMNELNDLGINFVSQQQGIDTTTPIGEAMFGISAIFAQLELKQIKARVNAGIRRAQSCRMCQHGKHKGVLCTSKAPDGLALCGCAVYAPMKYTGRSGWVKPSTKRGPASISDAVRGRVLALRGTAPQRQIAALAGCSQGTVQRVFRGPPLPVLNLNPPPLLTPPRSLDPLWLLTLTLKRMFKIHMEDAC